VVEDLQRIIHTSAARKVDIQGQGGYDLQDGESGQQMYKGKAISRFLSLVDEFGQLLLVTDEEVEKLFGEEVVAALAELGHFDREGGICSSCGGDCCRDMGCELYTTLFKRCPIYDLRPIICRLHFCHRFDAGGKSLVIELRDLFFGCFRAVDFWDSGNLRSLDVPPLAGAPPELMSALLPIMTAVQQGSLDPERAAELIRCQARDYHSKYLRHKSLITPSALQGD